MSHDYPPDYPQSSYPTCQIDETAVIDPGATIGAGSKIWHWTHVRESASIGKDCTIGQGCYIDVIIGDRCKVQNGVSIYAGVTLEDEVFIGPHVTFTNDKYPRAVGAWRLTPTLVCRGASIGAGAVILCGITIGEGAMVAAGAVITKDVEPYTQVSGVAAGECRVVFDRRTVATGGFHGS